jgi:phosphatidylglycerophosphatase A
MSKLAVLVATAGYAGFVPIAPGTAGSLVGLLLYAGLRWTGSSVAETLALVIVFVLGTWSAEVLEKRLGKDPRQVVIDEVLGMLVAVAFLNATISGAITAFFIFRVLDVVKPFPAGRLEHLHGGPGIMLDDVVAGLYSNLLMRLLGAAFPGLFI